MTKNDQHRLSLEQSPESTNDGRKPYEPPRVKLQDVFEGHVLACSKAPVTTS